MVSEVPRIKLHNLVELLVKDPIVDPLQLNTTGVMHRLEIVHQKYKDALARKGRDDKLIRCIVKLLLLKFNRQIINQPAQKRQFENELRKVSMEKWLYLPDRSNTRWKEINKVIYAALYDTIQTNVILKVIYDQKSYSGKKTWKIVEQQFTDNAVNSIATEKAMKSLNY